MLKLLMIEKMGHGLPKRVCQLALPTLISHFRKTETDINHNQPHDFDDRGFETTQNARGFMHTLNDISHAFIAFSADAPGLIVDIGAAYGVATLPIIQQGRDVVACDMDNTHLTTIQQRVPPSLRHHLHTQHGQFPHDIRFAPGQVGAVLLSHILPFLNPDEMDEAISKVATWLAPKGKVFIACYSPYMACFKRFIPLYEQRLQDGIRWPCWVENNVTDYLEAPSDVLNNLPHTMNYLDHAPLTQALQQHGFAIERADYLDPKKNNIPEGLLMDGREWSGVIAMKL